MVDVTSGATGKRDRVRGEPPVKGAEPPPFTDRLFNTLPSEYWHTITQAYTKPRDQPRSSSMCRF